MFDAHAAPENQDQIPLNWPAAPNGERDNAKAQELVDKAHLAFTSGRFETAVSLNTELLRIKPADARVLFNRGVAYYRLRDLNSALSDFNASLELAPDLYLALMNRGNVLSQFKRYDEAIADYGRAVALKPDQFLIFFNRGIAFGRRGHYEKSLRDLTRSIELNPNDAMSYSSRGDVFFRLQKFDEARRDYEKAVALDSSLSHAANRLRVLAGGAPQPEGSGLGIDTSTITTEVSHQGMIEQLVELASTSCLQNGENEKGLAGVAAANGWSGVGEAELKRSSASSTTMINGWTFSTEAGPAAIMQSKVNDAADVYICSMTVKLASPPLASDFKSVFERKMKVTLASPLEQHRDTTLRYWLPHTRSCDAKTSVVISNERGVVTVRMLHGRKADGA